MAIAILEVLTQHGSVEQDALAAAFARRFEADMERGYGPMAYSIGAYFADHLAEAARQAQLSAVITHAHPDGQAGAIAVVVAAASAHASRQKGSAAGDAAVELFAHVLAHTPDGPTREGIMRAAQLGPADAAAAAVALGDGTLVRSGDTVPLSLWCAARHLDDYEAALFTALDACREPAADRDTVCAIVGSIVVLFAGLESIPARWLESRERLSV